MSTAAPAPHWNYYVELGADVAVADTICQECIGEIGPFDEAADALNVACTLVGRRVSDVLGLPHAIPYCTSPGVDHRRAVVDHFTVGRVDPATGETGGWELTGSLAFGAAS